jgi:TRAP-type C4-dicarboxylate transport system permease large subunit
MMGTVAFFARRNGWGGDTPFSWPQLGEAAVEILVVLAFPVAVWLMMRAGVSPNLSIGIALAALLRLDWYYDFAAVMALMAPVILIGGMTLGPVHADRGGRGGGALVALPRASCATAR